MLLPLILVQSLSAQLIPNEVLQGLENNSVYTEPDGLTKWERKEGGEIIKYHFGRNEINKIYFPDGSRKVFNVEGKLILDEKGDGEAVVYDRETGEIENVLEEGRIIHYEDGSRSKIESTQSHGEEIAVSLDENNYRLKHKNTIYFIKTNEEQEVVSVRHSTSFKKDFRTSIEDGAVIKELLNPVDGTVYYSKSGNEKISVSFKYSLQFFIINLFNKPIGIEKAQELFNNNFKS